MTFCLVLNCFPIQSYTIKRRMASYFNLKIKGTSRCERGEHFWTASDLAIKFKVETEWLKAVRSTESSSKPNYGIGTMDSSHEEIVGNKMELVGPLLDTYLREIGKAIKNSSQGRTVQDYLLQFCCSYHPQFLSILWFLQLAMVGILTKLNLEIFLQ